MKRTLPSGLEVTIYRDQTPALAFSVGNTLFYFFSGTELINKYPRRYFIPYRLLPPEHYEPIRTKRHLTDECIEWILRRVITHPPAAGSVIVE